MASAVAMGYAYTVRPLHFAPWMAGLLLSSSCAYHTTKLVTTPRAAPRVEPMPVPVATTAAPPAPTGRVLRISRPVGESSPIFSVQTDAAHVYFNDGAGQLWVAPKDGSARARSLVADPHDSVRSFVVDGDTVYYAAREEVRTVAVTGGPTSHGVENAAGPILLVGDGKMLYHSVFNGSATYRWAVGTPHEERFCGGGKHQTLAVDGVNLYIASYTEGTITAVSKKTRRTRLLASGVRHPVRIAVDAGYVYFASEADGTVRRVAKRGGRVDVLARGQRNQEHLALDSSYVYWTTKTKSGKYALMRAPLVPRAGTEPEAMYSGLASAAGLSVDDGYVYVADRGAGEVVRVKKTLD